MVFNQIGGLLAVGNGLLPLRKAAQLQREKDQLAEFLAAHAALGPFSGGEPLSLHGG